MKLHRNYRLAPIVISDPTRHGIGNARLEAHPSDDTRGILVATDGVCLVALSVPLSPGDSPGYVTATALETARKAGKAKAPTVDLVANGELKITTEDGKVTSEPRPEEDGGYPKWRSCIPGKGPTVQVSINADLLWRVAQAMGTDRVTLTVCVDAHGQATLNPVMVAPAFPGEAYDTGITVEAGIIMPIRAE